MDQPFRKPAKPIHPCGQCSPYDRAQLPGSESCRRQLLHLASAVNSSLLPGLVSLLLPVRLIRIGVTDLSKDFFCAQIHFGVLFSLDLGQ